MKFEITGMEYQDLKEHLDELVLSHDLRTYKLKKEFGFLPGYWLSLIVNKRQWLKTWRETGNNIKDSKNCFEKSFTEELHGMGYDNVKVKLIDNDWYKKPTEDDPLGIKRR